MKLKKIPFPVLILGLVSFFNDLASEMIYPIVPLFLTTVLHTSIPVIGLIEGFVEATASLTKYFFGAYSDYLKQRKFFIILGYSFGAVSKLLIGLAYGWPMVLGARFVDRLGKGLRTAPRDSLLLENTTPQNKGFIFGIHRSFDSLGAVFGPLIALLVLALFKDNLRLSFFIAFLPGCVAVLLLSIFVKEKKKAVKQETPRFVKISWSGIPLQLKLFLVASFIFALGNSSDVFLLLRASSLGLNTTLVVLVYILYNVSQTIFATPAGMIADKLGAKNVFIGGLVAFAIVYGAIGLTQHSWPLWILFPLYGLYIAATDGVSKSYLSEFIKKEESGTYFGAYYTLTAVGTFFASVIGGLLWNYVHSSMTFFYGSAMAMIAFFFLIASRNLKSKVN